MKLEQEWGTNTEVRTYVDLIKYVENTLGWTWPWEDTRPPWKIRAIEAGKIKKLAQKRRVTVPELAETVNWMRKERITVKTPTAVMFYVERALKERVSKEEAFTDVEREVAETVVEIKASDLPEQEKKKWLTRMHRVRGPAAAEAVVEWRSR